MKGYDVKKEGDNWKFQQHKSERSIRNFESKKDAVGFATSYMREHEGTLKIKKVNGQIQEERTYPRSKDPSRTPG